MRPFKDAGEDARITAGREAGATSIVLMFGGRGFERGTPTPTQRVPRFPGPQPR
jgi:hypothetical protein